MNNCSLFEIGLRIQNLRYSFNLTQEELAEKMEVSRLTITKWETGRQDLKTSQIIKLCDFFNVSADYLLGRTDVESLDTDLQSVCEYTGLSEEAVTQLTVLKLSQKEYYHFTYILDFINYFINSNKFYMILSEIDKYVKSKLICKMILEIYPNEHIAEMCDILSIRKNLESGILPTYSDDKEIQQARDIYSIETNQLQPLSQFKFQNLFNKIVVDYQDNKVNNLTYNDFLNEKKKINFSQIKYTDDVISASDLFNNDTLYSDLFKEKINKEKQSKEEAEKNG